MRIGADSSLEGAGFEPSVPRERGCVFRDHVHSLQSVRRPLRSEWYIDNASPFGVDQQVLSMNVEAKQQRSVAVRLAGPHQDRDRGRAARAAGGLPDRRRG